MAGRRLTGGGPELHRDVGLRNWQGAASKGMDGFMCLAPSLSDGVCPPECHGLGVCLATTAYQRGTVWGARADAMSREKPLEGSPCTGTCPQPNGHSRVTGSVGCA